MRQNNIIKHMVAILIVLLMNTMNINAQNIMNIGSFKDNFEYNGLASYGEDIHFTLEIPLFLQIDFPEADKDKMPEGYISIIRIKDGNYQVFDMTPGQYFPYYSQTKLEAGTYFISIGIREIQNIDITIKGLVYNEEVEEQPEIVTPGVSVNPTLAPLSENKVTSFTYTEESGKSRLENVQFFDGIGRLKQLTEKEQTPLKKDLVTFHEYDDFNRKSRIWLPFIHSGETIADIKNQYADNYPYQEFQYENSSLDQLSNIFNPGADWYKNNKLNKIRYLTNEEAIDNLKILFLNLSIDGETISSSKLFTNWRTGMFTIEQQTNENGDISYIFKDKKGQVVLTRNIVNEEQLDTYYLYDYAGNLCFVIPPILSPIIEQLFLDNNIISWTSDNEYLKKYAYMYKYDASKRCIWKKLPGCDPIHYVYDKADQLIFSQDGENRSKGEWAFSIPDVFGRVVLSGVCKDTISISNKIVKGVYSSTGSYNRYNIQVDGENKKFTHSPVIYSVNFYDNYDFRGMTGIPASGTEYTSEAGFGSQYTSGYKGLLTGTITKDLNVGKSLYSVMYYDNRGRLIQTKSNNFSDNGLEKEYIAYNFVGQPIKKKHVHTAVLNGKSKQIEEVYSYNYDHAGRLLDTKLEKGGKSIILAKNEYDELGRLKSNSKNGKADLTTNFTYNIRSWTESISSPLFSQNLYYNNSLNNSTPQYNGNISAMEWTVKGDKPRGYTFNYDNLSRLTDANYLENKTSSNKYSTGYTYDKHGNMLKLSRNGASGLLDNLQMTYNGNQLIKASQKEVFNQPLTSSLDKASCAGFSLEDGFSFKATDQNSLSLRADESLCSADAFPQESQYAYNKNGALIKDLGKGIYKIEYNSLNLPQTVYIKNATTEAIIEYTYSAAGVKLRVKKSWNPGTISSGAEVNKALLTKTKQTDYLGNKIYEDGELKTILVDGGYYDCEKEKYFFYLADHLGNNRVVADEDGNIVETNHYYPFGQTFAESTSQNVQPYKYNGKELDKDFGLNLYDYSARQMEPAIGRFTSMDPHAENYFSISPYAYVGNNPIKRMDPNGMDWWEDKDGNVKWEEHVKSKKDVPKDGKYLGSEYKGLTVKTYKEYKNGRYYGVTIELSYKGKDDEEYQWVQTINTNAPNDRRVKSPYVDPTPADDDLPYYHTAKDPKFRDGNIVSFKDTPKRLTILERFWDAELSLVKKTGQAKKRDTTPDHYEPLITITYGFTAKDRKVKVQSIKVKERPSSFHTKSINQKVQYPTLLR